MSFTLLSESQPVARKPHRCIWCGQTIPAGEKYRNDRIAWEGTIAVQHWHFECFDAQQAEARETHEYEFLPYENDRPTVGVNGIDGPRRGPEADGSQKPNDAAEILCAKAGSNPQKLVPDPACTTCHGHGRYVAGYSGREDDGNAPIWEDCDCFIPYGVLASDQPQGENRG